MFDKLKRRRVMNHWRGTQMAQYEGREVLMEVEEGVALKERKRQERDRSREGGGDGRYCKESRLALLNQAGVPVFLYDVIRGSSSTASAAPSVSRL